MCHTQICFIHNWRLDKSALPAHFYLSRLGDTLRAERQYQRAKSKTTDQISLSRHPLLWCIFRTTGKRWRTYWKCVKWYSITGRWGGLPERAQVLNQLRGHLPTILRSSALLQRNLLRHRLGIALEDKWAIYRSCTLVSLVRDHILNLSYVF